jgi:hypothetical protein
VDDHDDAAYARAPEPGDLARLCRALNDAGENIARLKQGLSILADNAAEAVGLDDVRQHVVVRVADEIVVDLMGRACGLSYADVAADQTERYIEGVSIPVASPASLIRTKNTYRPQDAIDRAFLERLLAPDDE